MWKEGLFIMPQHLQLMDQYHERLLDQRLNALGANTWGVAELEVDHEELVRGVFRIRRCTAVMPDGMLVRVGPDSQLKGVLAMTGGALVGGRQILEIYLGVPAHSSGPAAEAQVDGASGTRFLQSREMVHDAFGVAEDAEVECLRPNVQLLLGHTNRQNFVTLKLAELVVSEGGVLRLTDYIPPCLKIGASPTIMQRLTGLVSALGAKQRSLVDKYGGRIASMMEFGAADVATFWYLHTVNSWTPTFMHYAETGQVDPERLYLSLVSFAGQLATFELGTNPMNLPAFHYLDLAGTFLPLFDHIMHLLGTVVSARYTPIPLEHTQPGLFVGRVTDPQLLRMRSLYLVLGGDVSEKVLREEVPDYIKIGSVDQIAAIVKAALPGVNVSVDLSPPAGIPIRSHMVYLRIDKVGRAWDGIEQSSTIAVYQPYKPDIVRLELLAVEG
jgi:type VI secretion system protein ImpJ